MHCSICRSSTHNKRGHHNHVEPSSGEETEDEQEDYNDYMDMEVNPTEDPSQAPETMVYNLFHQNQPARQNDHGPLPDEPTFVAEHRDAILPPRMTTTMSASRGRATDRGRGRGRGRSSGAEEGADVQQAPRGRGVGTRGRRGRTEQQQPEEVEEEDGPAGPRGRGAGRSGRSAGNTTRAVGRRGRAAGTANRRGGNKHGEAPRSSNRR